MLSFKLYDPYKVFIPYQVPSLPFSTLHEASSDSSFHEKSYNESFVFQEQAFFLELSPRKAKYYTPSKTVQKKNLQEPPLHQLPPQESAQRVKVPSGKMQQCSQEVNEPPQEVKEPPGKESPLLNLQKNPLTTNLTIEETLLTIQLKLEYTVQDTFPKSVGT